MPETPMWKPRYNKAMADKRRRESNEEEWERERPPVRFSWEDTGYGRGLEP